MDRDAVTRVRALLRRMADRHDLTVTEAYVFGSRVRDDYGDESDVDLVVVSPDFEGLPSYKRAKEFYKEWQYPPDLEVKCYTPGEFESLKDRVSIARTAAEEGVAVT